MTCDTPRFIEDDEWLSQAGSRRADGSWKFRDLPRALKVPPELDISMVLGRLTPLEVKQAAYGKKSTAEPRDAVRHVQAGALRSAGFRVEHTPRHPGSPLHVSVFWNDEDTPWDDKVAAMLHAACMGGEVGV